MPVCARNSGGDGAHCWRAEDPDFLAALGELPEVPAAALEERIYAAPSYWAPFMLIGGPD